MSSLEMNFKSQTYILSPNQAVNSVSPNQHNWDETAMSIPSTDLYNLFSGMNESAFLSCLWSIWTNKEKFEKQTLLRQVLPLGIFRDTDTQVVSVLITTLRLHNTHLLPHCF